MNNPYGYKLLRQQLGERYKLAHYCFSYTFALKILDMYKKRKIIVLGEPKDAIKKSKWKIVPITKHEAVQAEKMFPSDVIIAVGIFYFISKIIRKKEIIKNEQNNFRSKNNATEKP